MPTRLRSVSVLLGLLLTAPTLAATPPPSPYAELAQQEARVAAIGFRLTTANAAWCPATQPQFGWIWGDPRLYDAKNRAEALAAYGASPSDDAFIAAVAPGSPAAAAGLHPGSPVTSVNGMDVAPPIGSDPFERIGTLEILFAALPTDAPARVADGSASASIMPVRGCVSDFRVEARDRLEGVADGRLVLVNAGLVGFAVDDAELAAPIAHELAHNILRHRARLDAAGVDRGLGKQFGRNARLFRQTEVEADRLSAWLLAGAGYDPHAAVRFWTNFGEKTGNPLFQAGTHPRWRARVASIETEIAAIEAARAAGRSLEPPLIAAPPPLE